MNKPHGNRFVGVVSYTRSMKVYSAISLDTVMGLKALCIPQVGVTHKNNCVIPNKGQK